MREASDPFDAAVECAGVLGRPHGVELRTRLDVSPQTVAVNVATHGCVPECAYTRQSRS
jgi:hypothetical protein